MVFYLFQVRIRVGDPVWLATVQPGGKGSLVEDGSATSGEEWQMSR